MRCLSTFSGCGGAYGFTFTSLPLQTLPQIYESWAKSYLMQLCKPCHYTLVQAVEPLKLHPMSMWYLVEVSEHLLRLWMGTWLHTHTITTTDAPQIWESWLKCYLMQVWKPCHFALVEAVKPLKLHPMSMSYIYEVFEHFLRMWMGIWLHTHTVTTTDTSPDLWELAEILPFASLQTMPLQFGWGCRTLQIASILYEIHSLGFFSAFSGCGWAYGFTLTSLSPQTIPQSRESWLKTDLMQVCKPCHYILA